MFRILAVSDELTLRELGRERDELKRSMNRSSVTAVVVFLLAIALAVAAFLMAGRAREKGAEARENLWQALVSEAESGGKGEKLGTKEETLEAVTEAAKIRTTPGLRDRAIEALAMTDLKVVDEVRGLGGSHLWGEQGSAWSGDLERVYIGNRSGGIDCYEMPSGEKIKSYTNWRLGKPAEPGHFGFLSAGEKFVGVVGRSGSGVVWDVASGKKLVTVDQQYDHYPYRAFAFHPLTENWLAFCDVHGKEIRIVDVENKGGEVKRLKLGGAPVTLRFSRDGRFLAVEESGDRVSIYDWKEGELLKQMEMPFDLIVMDWHPDGLRMAFGGADAVVRVYDVWSGVLLRSIEAQEKWVHRLTFNGAGDLLATEGWDNQVKIFDTESGEPLLRSFGMLPEFFHHDGRMMADIRMDHAVRFELGRSEVFRPLASELTKEGKFYGLDFSRDGKWVTAGGSEGLVVWDVETGRVLGQAAGSFFGAWFSNDGKWLVSIPDGPGEVKKWPLRIGEPDLVGEGVSLGRYYGGRGVRTAGGKWLYFSNHMNGYGIDLDRLDQVHLILEDLTHNQTSNLVQSADGEWIVHSPWYHDPVIVYDAKTGEREKVLKNFGWGAAFHPDSMTLATADWRSVNFYEVGTWEEVAKVLRPENTPSYCLGLDWSGDGRLLATGGEDGEVVIYSGEKPYRRVATLRAPYGDTLTRAKFSPDGKMIAASGQDGRCHLWNLEKLEQEIRDRGLHWDDDGKDAQEGSSAVGVEAVMTGAGALAALFFGLGTVKYQRGLMKKYGAVEELARSRTDDLRQAEVGVDPVSKDGGFGESECGDCP